MIKLRLIQPNQPALDVTLEGDTAVIGRDSGCDVVLKHKFVSKRHAQIFRGIVIVDLGSANGTFVGDAQLMHPELLKGRTFTLGRGDFQVTVEVDGADAEGAITRGAPRELDASSSLRLQLEQLARRNAELTEELARARDTAPPTRGEVGDLRQVREELEAVRRKSAELDRNVASQQSKLGEERAKFTAQIQELTDQRDDLRKRLESLKNEVEDSEVSASATLQAKLAEQQMIEVQRQYEELARRQKDVESKLSEARSAHADAVAALRKSEDQRAQLQKQLDSAQPSLPDLPPTEIFVRLQKEIRDLKATVARYETGDARPGVPASTIFFELQTENRELRRKLQALEKVDTPPPTGDAANSGADATADAKKLRVALTAANEELEKLRRRVAAMQYERNAVVGTVESGPGGGLRVMRMVVDHDLDQLAPLKQGPADEFVFLETLRLLRKVEKITTRIAGDSVQLFELKTMLPSVEGTLRSAIADVVRRPEHPAARDGLSRYLDETARWLVAAVGASRIAATEFALHLKSSLSEDALTKGRPLSGLKKIPGQRESELWKRATACLAELTPEVIGDRVEQITRKAVVEIHDGAKQANTSAHPPRP